MFEITECDESSDPFKGTLIIWSAHIGNGSVVSHFCQWNRGCIHYMGERRSKDVVDRELHRGWGQMVCLRL